MGFCNKPCVLSPLHQGQCLYLEAELAEQGLKCLYAASRSSKVTNDGSQLFCPGSFPAKCYSGAWPSLLVDGPWLAWSSAAGEAKSVCKVSCVALDPNCCHMLI